METRTTTDTTIATLAAAHAAEAICQGTVGGRLARDEDGVILLPQDPQDGDWDALDDAIGREPTADEQAVYRAAWRSAIDAAQVDDRAALVEVIAEGIGDDEALRRLRLCARRDGVTRLPGTDLARHVVLDDDDAVAPTVRAWQSRGWVRLAGEGVVLTQAGYRAV